MARTVLLSTVLLLASAAPAAEPARSALRTDLNGDSLPAGAVARFGTVRLRHDMFVESIAFTPDGRMLLTHSWDGVRLWDTGTGRMLDRFGPEAEHVITAALSTDGKILADVSFHKEGTIRLREFTTGKLIRRFGQRRYERISFSPDGKLLVAHEQLGALNSHDTKVEVWDATTGRLQHSWEAHKDIVWVATFSTDGKSLYTGGADAVIRVWDVATARLLREITGNPNEVERLSVSPDGRVLASIGATKIEHGMGTHWQADSFVRLWDVNTGKEIRRLGIAASEHLPATSTVPPSAQANQSVSVGQSRRIFDSTLPTLDYLNCLTFSPDGRLLVAGRADYAVHVWDVSTGKELRRFEGASGYTGAVAVSRDGRMLASVHGGNNIRLRDFQTGKDLTPTAAQYGPISAVVVAPDGRKVATAETGRTISLWDPATGKERHRLTGHEKSVLAIVLIDGGKILRSAGEDGTLRAWDVATGKELSRTKLPALPSIAAFSPDGKLLAAADPLTGNFQSWPYRAEHRIRLIDAATARELKVLDLQKTGAFQLVFSANGRTLVAPTPTGLRIWEMPTGRPLRYPAGKPGTGERLPYPDRIALSPDGGLLASEVPPGMILLAETGGDTILRRLERSPPLALPPGAFSNFRTDGTPTSSAHFTFSPDGRSFAWGAGNDILFSEVATGRQRLSLTGHRGTITALAFSADGRTLVSGSDDSTALVWDLGPIEQSGRTPEACWDDLFDADAARAYHAIRCLAGMPERSVPYLERQLSPAATAEGRLAKLVSALDADRFDAWQPAVEELGKLGAVTEGVSQAPFGERLPRDVGRSVESVLEQMEHAVTLRAVRAVEALEMMGTPEARRLLQKLAGGAPGAWLTMEARASLGRMGRRQ